MTENAQNSQRKHAWREQTDADGDPYKYCTREGCGIIWSHMHGQTEPVGCQGK